MQPAFRRKMQSWWISFPHMSHITTASNMCHMRICISCKTCQHILVYLCPHIAIRSGSPPIQGLKASCTYTSAALNLHDSWTQHPFVIPCNKYLWWIWLGGVNAGEKVEAGIRWYNPSRPDSFSWSNLQRKADGCEGGHHQLWGQRHSDSIQVFCTAFLSIYSFSIKRLIRHHTTQ